jgi:hypothetical protein
MRPTRKKLCLSLAMLSLALGDQIAAAGASVHPPAVCHNLSATVSGRDFTDTASSMMSTAADAGFDLFQSVANRRTWASATQSFPDLQGETPLLQARVMLRSRDMCFAPGTTGRGYSSDACNARPAQGNTVLFGCEERACGSKWALLIGRDDELIAIATTSFATARWGGLNPAGQDIMLFVENAAYPRDEIRRTLGAWVLLPEHFVRSNFAGDQWPDLDALSRVNPRSEMQATIRECVLG